MGGLLRKLLIYICKPIYKGIVYVYKIFYNLANTHILSQDIIQQLSSNIYVLVSVVMLFAFSITILSAIVNPDLLSDKKKGVTAIFKRSIIGLALMVIVPFGFTELYKIQESIMTNSVIEKIVIGVDFSCKDSDSECEAGGNGGQVIAGTLISSVLYPVDEEVKIAADVSESYTMMVASDISYIGDIAKNINVTREGDTDESFHLKFDDEDYAFNFDGLLAILVGGATVYILVLFAMDVAVRIFKLAFLELTAPISIVGYIAAGDKILSSWFKELLSTYVSLFVRIAAMAFYLFLISNLSTFTKSLGENDWTFVFKAFLVVGMLIFVKQLPDMINKVFGTNIKMSGGGIGGRLGEMALVGKQAQKAWGAVKNVAGLGAAGLGLGAAALTPVGAGAIAGGIASKKLWDNKLKDTKFGRGATAAGKTVGSFIGGKSTVDGLKSGRKTWNETGFGTDRKYNKDRKADNMFNEKIGLDEYGRVKAGELSSTAGNFNSNIDKDFGKMNAEKIKQFHKANVAKSEIEAISGKSKDVVDKLESMKLSARTTDGKQALASIQEDFQAGNLSASQLRTRLKDLYNKGEVQASSVRKVSSDIDAIEGIITKSSNEKINSLVDNGELKMNSVSGMSKELTENYDFAKNDYDKVYKNQSESVKADMDRYVAASSSIAKATIDSNKKSINNTTDGQKYMDQINATDVYVSDSNDQSLNLNLSKTSSEPIKQDGYNISSDGKFKLKDE